MAEIRINAWIAWVCGKRRIDVLRGNRAPFSYVSALYNRDRDDIRSGEAVGLKHICTESFPKDTPAESGIDIISLRTCAPPRCHGPDSTCCRLGVAPSEVSSVMLLKKHTACSRRIANPHNGQAESPFLPFSVALTVSLMNQIKDLQMIVCHDMLLSQDCVILGDSPGSESRQCCSESESLLWLGTVSIAPKIRRPKDHLAVAPSCGDCP